MARYEEATWRDSMRIRFDYTNMLAEVAGSNRGATEAELKGMEPRFSAALDVLRTHHSSKEITWLNLTKQQDVATDVLSYAREVAGVFDDVLLLGIGGSALGVTALKTALLPLYSDYLSLEERQGPRLFVLENVDPDWVMPTLRLLDPDRTLCIVSSKSGSTTETMAQFLIAREWLRQALGDGAACHLMAITDPGEGPLREIASREGYRTFPVPPGVGGRYSVLSPVGLVPAALVGIDIQELLAGAAYADEICSVRQLRANPAGMNAALQYLAYQRGQRISVLMPYSQHLRDVADWFRQLWAESLAKKMNTLGRRVNIGPTPVRALGTTDQHSQIQLYVEGPPDKVINIVAVEHFTDEGPIAPAGAEEAEISYLGGHTLAELINVEREATTAALTEAGKPNCTHFLPEVNPFTVGQFLYMLEMQAAVTALFFAVNAYDQPGVEAGKVAAYALLGRSGYEEQALALRSAEAARRRHVI